jgi:hypothetical protein
MSIGSLKVIENLPNLIYVYCRDSSIHKCLKDSLETNLRIYDMNRKSNIKDLFAVHRILKSEYKLTLNSPYEPKCPGCHSHDDM